MCNGTSSRTSVGGAIAIINPSPTSPPLSEPFQLLFSNALNDANELHTTIDLRPTFNDSDSNSDSDSDSDSNSKSFGQDEQEEGEYTLIIHQHGDLTSSIKSNEEPMHSIALRSTCGRPQLVRHMQLDFGTRGVIGRMVSVRRNGVVLGVGVIGWN